MTCNLSINFLNDQTIYCPGQNLCGTVTINITEKSQFSGLQLSINGSAICKFKDSQNESFFNRDVTFTGQERYITTSMYLFGSSRGDLKQFKAGIFTYQFRYRLPHAIPPSTKGKYGRIRYFIEASLQTNWEHDIYGRISFSIIRFEDLSNRFDLMLPISDEESVSFCCWSCKTQPLHLFASIPFSGFIPGSVIRVTVKIDNRCGFDVSKTIISLKKIHTFISQLPSARVWSEEKTILKNVIDGARHGRESKIFGIIEVPPFTLASNDDSRLIRVSYIIQVSLDVVGMLRSPKVKLPIVIGSKPLKFENKQSC